MDAAPARVEDAVSHCSTRGGGKERGRNIHGCGTASRLAPSSSLLVFVVPKKNPKIQNLIIDEKHSRSPRRVVFFLRNHPPFASAASRRPLYIPTSERGGSTEGEGRKEERKEGPLLCSSGASLTPFYLPLIFFPLNQSSLSPGSARSPSQFLEPGGLAESMTGMTPPDENAPPNTTGAGTDKQRTGAGNNIATLC